MNGKQVFLSAVLAGFSLLTAVAIYDYGYVGLFEVGLSNLVGVLVLTDLVIALSLVIAWMAGDAKERGISPLPYIVLTFAFGSVGPLLYLIRREGRLAAGAPGPVRAAASGV